MRRRDIRSLSENAEISVFLTQERSMFACSWNKNQSFSFASNKFAVCVYAI